MSHTPDTEALGHIGKILVDQTRLYGRAAEIAEGELAAAIRRAQVAREKLLRDVNALLINEGDAAIDEGTMLGAGHKVFLNLRAGVDKDDKAAIGEVERGEDFLRDEISKCAGKKDVSDATRRVFTQMLSDIAPTHAEISRLKRRMQ